MTQPTVRVRVAVLINAEGRFEGDETNMMEDLRQTFIDCERLDANTVVRWIEADVPIPTAETCKGHVVPWPAGY